MIEEELFLERYAPESGRGKTSLRIAMEKDLRALLQASYAEGIRYAANCLRANGRISIYRQTFREELADGLDKEAIRREIRGEGTK